MSRLCPDAGLGKAEASPWALFNIVIGGKGGERHRSGQTWMARDSICRRMSSMLLLSRMKSTVMWLTPIFS